MSPVVLSGGLNSQKRKCGLAIAAYRQAPGDG